MFNINRVTLLGNVTQDPEVRASKAGKSVASIGFATTSRKKNADGKYVDEPEYHNLVCFGSMADISAKNVQKGAPLYIEGRLHTSRYKTKDGEDKSRTEIIVDELVLLGGKKGKGDAPVQG